MTAETFDPTAIIFTDAAAARVRELISEEGNDQLGLRVYVTGGGCSGFQYGFSFDENVADDDTVVNNGDMKLVVDSMSIQYLFGSTVDYIEGLEGAKFMVNNPSATSTCGCGASFTI